MNKMVYMAPDVYVFDVEVEGGYLLSGVVDGGDYGDGGEGVPME